MVEVFEGDNEIKTFRLILPRLGIVWACPRVRLRSPQYRADTNHDPRGYPGHYTALDTFYTSLDPVSVCLIILEIETVFDEFGLVSE